MTPSCCFVLLEYGDVIAHVVEAVCGGKAGRTAAYDSHMLAVALRTVDSDIPLKIGTLGNGAFVLPVCHGFTCREVKDTGLLAECRTDTAGKFREWISLLQQFVCCLPFAMV